MIVGCFVVLGWLSALGGRLLRVAPLHTVASVLASLFSQILQIAAFLLPLKVMILLGSHRVPSYFPQILAEVERERLILLLATAAVMLYLAHLLMDFIGAALARRGSVKLIELELEGDAGIRQQKIALNLYRRFIVVASGATFGLAVLLFFGLFRPTTLGVVLAYFVAVFLLTELLFACLPRLLDHALVQFARLVDVLSACGFLLVFGLLVVEFLYGNPEGLLLGILALLLCRQLFSRLSMVLKNIERLYRDREKTLAALIKPQGLFHEGYQEDEEDEEQAIESPGLLDGGSSTLVKADRKVRSRRPYWDMVAPEQSGDLLKDMLAVVGSTVVKVEQFEAGLRGQLLLHVTGHKSGQAPVHFLFRLFHSNHAQLAARTAELLRLYPGERSPTLLAEAERNGFPAHLYYWLGDALPVIDAQSIRECREQVFIECSAWSVPQELQRGSGQPTLVERCNRELWLRCQAFSRWMDEDTRVLVDAFVNAPERLSSALGNLPLRIYNPDVAAGHVYVSASGYKVTWWGRWCLEPIGSGWPLELGLERLEHVFAGICERCEELRALSVLQVQLAALAFAFEGHCAEGAYLAAFPRLREISDVLEKLER